ncbi:MAG: glycoside hydrolase family 3 protein [Oscillospiraceae bacterium]|nr:glycoside hydrolase family 3 protein [Oscillospiraceae bacterium]
MKKTNFWRGMTALFTLLFALAMFGQALAFHREGDVNLFLGTLPPAMEVSDDTNYYPSSFETKDEMRTALQAHLIQAQEEGSVLLRNENGALPLTGSESVTLFGFAAASPVYHGGSGGPSNSGVNLYDALKEAGVNVNETVYNAIVAAGGTRTKTGLIGEIPVSAYQGTESSFASYGDAAIYVMSRFGGEEGDLNHGLQNDWQEGPAIRELALHEEEIATLEMIREAGFKKVIVVLNSGYAMELGELPEYGVDAILWIGYPGNYGMYGVANILTGKADPSGRNVITYAANSLSSAAMQNAGDFTFTNLTGLYKNKYLVYAEGIYVGYKYYETRYQDEVLGVNNAVSAKGAYMGDEWHYDDEMVYSFGEGESYADFTVELKSLDWDRTSHTVTAQVNVTNNGGFEGKSKYPVQLYVSLPWEPGQAEKSAIQLVDFAKTGYLSAGESETVTITVSDYLFAAYDQNAVNGADSSKQGCYVFDAGDYYFSVGNGAHDALNNVLKAKGADVEGNADNTVKVTLDALDNTTWAVSPYTGAVVSNHFEDRDINYFIPGTVTYLTRGDWETFPEAVTDLTATPEIQDLMENFQYEKPADAPDISVYKYKQDNGISFIDMKDVAFDDNETWDAFIDQLTVTELAQIVGDKMGLDTIPSIDFPAYAGGDGPDGYQAGGVLFAAEMVDASAFNKEVIEKRGDFFAEESFWLGFRHTYAPGGNIHRTPYSGRNFEYYSEDAILSYICGEIQTRAMAQKGLVGTFKHFCGNDQETNRHGVAEFMTEQAYREGPMKGFEGGLQKDHSLGTMTAYNRIGCIPTASDYETMTTVLRGEWGFTGINMTDSSKDSASYMGTGDALSAGTNQFNNDPGRVPEASNYLTKDRDGFIWGKLREVAKYYLYSMSRSNLVNGLAKEVPVADYTPWWKPAMIGLDVALGILTAGSCALFLLSWNKARKEEKA